MIESYAYDLIKEEGLKEGLERGKREGLLEGKREGMLEGKREGMLEEAREMVLEGLAERFKAVPKDLEEAIKSIESRTVLKELHRAIFRARNLQGFRKFLNEMLVKT